jgi:hypothetical protein
MRRLRFLALFDARRAVSAVISNVILIGAVIVVGFAVLSWANSQANSYSSSYGKTVSSDINKLEEKIAFEYIFYNKVTTSLSAYIINCGLIDGVKVSQVSVSNSSWSYTYYNIQLKLLNNTSTSQINRGQEAYFSTFPVTLTSGGSYMITVLTTRGSSFETAFLA